MKLSTQQIAAIKQQTDADPVAEDHPAAGQLKEAFGDHTFYVDRNGLHVFEALEAQEGGGAPAALVQLAAWTDEDMTSLAPQEPQVGPVVVDLENQGGGDAGDGDGEDTPGGGSAA